MLSRYQKAYPPDHFPRRMQHVLRLGSSFGHYAIGWSGSRIMAAFGCLVTTESSRQLQDMDFTLYNSKTVFLER